ncbi:hypothetical protein AVEN_143442-1 [Araneus ventricosus]|uniref:Uncharacterized protein n=1 Tax=Araneus ventricosus TaxID=182803 RepID=A0A4Y2RSY1_ARAVE|nr:hypothetical protein AVEN_143442-1 [Araneus ventricosus]
MFVVGRSSPSRHWMLMRREHLHPPDRPNSWVISSSGKVLEVHHSNYTFGTVHRVDNGPKIEIVGDGGEGIYFKISIVLYARSNLNNQASQQPDLYKAFIIDNSTNTQ